MLKKGVIIKPSIIDMIIPYPYSHPAVVSFEHLFFFYQIITI